MGWFIVGMLALVVGIIALTTRRYARDNEMQAIVGVVGLTEGARLLPSLDTAAPVGVTLIDPRLG